MPLRAHQVDGQDLLVLQDDDLEALGIENLVERKAILEKTQGLFNSSGLITAPLQMCSQMCSQMRSFFGPSPNRWTHTCACIFSTQRQSACSCRCWMFSAFGPRVPPLLNIRTIRPCFLACYD
jgi:hypothetical protein